MRPVPVPQATASRIEMKLAVKVSQYLFSPVQQSAPFDFSEREHCRSGLQFCISTSEIILYWKIVNSHTNLPIVKV